MELRLLSRSSVSALLHPPVPRPPESRLKSSSGDRFSVKPEQLQSRRNKLIIGASTRGRRCVHQGMSVRPPGDSFVLEGQTDAAGLCGEKELKRRL